MLRRCVILQFEGVHEVTVPSFVASLNRLGWKPTILLNERCALRGDLFEFVSDGEFDLHYVPLISRADWDAVLDTTRGVDPDFVIVNTFQRDGIVKAALSLDVPVIGLVHNTVAFAGGTDTVAAQRRNDVALLTLWDHVSHSLRSRLAVRGDNIGTFYMTELPTGRNDDAGGDVRTVAITGGIDVRNRDLDTLVRALAALQEHQKIRDLRFIFCGGGADRQSFEEDVANAGLGDVIRFLSLGPEGWVPYSEYLATLGAADYIGALLPVARRDYLEHKVTSGCLSALALGRPMWADYATLATYQMLGPGYPSDDLTRGVRMLRESPPALADEQRRQCTAHRLQRAAMSDVALTRAIEMVMP